MAMPPPVSESEIWTLRQCLLKTKSALYSLQSQLYKSRACYKDRERELTLRLHSLQAENDSLRSLVEKCQSDLETFRQKVTWHVNIGMVSLSLVK